MQIISHEKRMSKPVETSDMFQIKENKTYEFLLQITEGFRGCRNMDVIMRFSEDTTFENAVPLFSQLIEKNHLNESSIFSVKFKAKKTGYARALYMVYGGFPITGTFNAFIYEDYGCV